MTTQALINVRFRRCLDGGTTQDVFVCGNQLFHTEYARARRQDVKSWSERSTRHILTIMQDDSRHAHDAAWRQAGELRLLEHDFQEVLQPIKCYPVFDANGLK